MSDLDRYIGNADAFPILRQWTFFNHAGVAPCSQVGADAMKRFVDELRNQVYLNTRWYADVETLRVSSARLINASPQEIAFIKNTSEGIATVAFGIDWKPGDRIITTAVEYPANIYPWMEVTRRHDAELIMVPEENDERGARHVPLDKILGEMEHPRTRLVTLSHVEFASGQRHDLATIGRVCRERGILFCIDAIQSMGVLPIDVRAMNVDYLAADGHKWLLGPEGAGFMYIRRELQDTTRPLLVGWMNVINADRYGDYDYTLKPDARRYEGGSWNVIGLLGLKASVELLVDAGTANIAARLKHLTDRLISGLRAKGYSILSPRTSEQWSGIVSFAHPHCDHASIVSGLRKDAKIEIALREGRLRASPHFYNTDSQIDALVAHLPVVRA